MHAASGGRVPVLISQRAAARGPEAHLAYAAWGEAEDVLVDTASARLGILDRHGHERSMQARRVLGRGLRRVAGPDARLPATSRDPIVQPGDDVFFLARGLWDLPLLERLRSVRRHAATVSVWIPEVWPSELEDSRLSHECYGMVDHLFVGIEEAIEPFERVARMADIHHLPPAIDVVRFAPADPRRPRGIDVLGLGRRDPGQHREILEWADSRQAMYLYDTVKGEAVDQEEHRSALARIYQHTGIVICNFAKHDLSSVHRGIRTLPGRLFEGIGAGAVLVGIPPAEATQRRIIGDLVVESVEDAPHGLTGLLDRFSQPAEADPIRIRNLVLACRGHDWGHRWADVLTVLGVEIPFGLRDRLDDLAKRADAYEGLAEAR